jgi:hypothetical protein
MSLMHRIFYAPLDAYHAFIAWVFFFGEDNSGYANELQAQYDRLIQPKPKREKTVKAREDQTMKTSDLVQEAIENAPHESECAAGPKAGILVPEGLCNCWKANLQAAMPRIKAEEAVIEKVIGLVGDGQDPYLLPINLRPLAGAVQAMQSLEVE